MLKNKRNRKLDKKKVSQYSQDMKSGRWKLTSQTIAFDTDGFLADGQHRLQAIIESDATIESLIVFGSDPSAFDVLDIGKNRTGNDIWGLAGYSGRNISAIASIVYLYFNYPDVVDWKNKCRPQSSHVLKWCTENNLCEIIQKSCNFERRFYNEIKGVSSVIGASLAIWEIDSGIPMETIWDNVYDRLLKMVGIEEGEPVYALNRILNKRDNPNSYRPLHLNPFRTKNNSGANVNRTRLSILLQVISDQVNNKARSTYSLQEGQKLIQPSKSAPKHIVT